jgi:hypothetical protein
MTKRLEEHNNRYSCQETSEPWEYLFIQLKRPRLGRVEKKAEKKLEEKGVIGNVSMLAPEICSSTDLIPSGLGDVLQILAIRSKHNLLASLGKRDWKCHASTIP